MRKRYLSRLLAGALLVASVSSFVSCKDYDDDINNLQEQINKAALREDLTNLSATLTTAIQNVKGATETAQATADQAVRAAADAQATADGKVSKSDYEAAVAALKAATEAVEASAKALGEKEAEDIAAVTKAAQEAYATAQAAIAKAQGKANEADSIALKAEADAKAAQTAADKAQEAANAARGAVLTLADEIAKGYASKEDLAKAEEAAKKAADEAKAAAEAAEKAAKAYADEKYAAAEKYADEAIQKALQTYDYASNTQIKKAIEDAISEALKSSNLDQVPKDLKEQLEKLAELQKELGKAEELKSSVDELKGELQKLNAETIEPMKTAVELFKKQIEEIYQAVTSVNLYITQTANQKYLDDRIGHGTVHLHFAYAKEKTNKFPQNLTVADKQYIFTDGNIYTLDREVLIRVSPATANLTADMIALYNSVGDRLPSNLVQVKSIEPYDEIMTRSMSPSGIWKVTFSLIDYKDNKAAFEAATSKKNKDVVFAVGVNNTPSEAGIGRTVFSEYDVLVKASEAVHAYDFNVNDEPVRNIHNRWSTCEDQTILTNIPSDRSKHVVELNWKPSRPGYETPAVSANDNNSGDRVESDYQNTPYYPYTNDNRQNCPILSVNAGEDIEIVYPEIDAFKALRGFYVTLDEAFAKESNMSEITAWRAYEYENVGYTKLDGSVQPAHMFDGNKGTISIKWMSNPDIIGFRVYAVNLDGTLVDPDGRAFYVQVGAVVNSKSVADANVTVTDKADKSYVDVTVDGATLFTDESDEYVPVWGDNNPLVYDNPGTPRLITPLEGESNKYETQTGTEVTRWNISDYVDFEFYDSDTDKWLTLAQFNALAKAKRDKITKIRAYIRNPQYLLDGETYLVKLQGRSTTVSSGSSASPMAVDEIAVKVKKVLPSDIPSELTVLTGLGSTINPLRVYVKPRYMYFDSSWRPADRMGDWYPQTWLPALPNPGNIWDVNNADANNYWIYGADVRPYDLADIFNGLYDTSQTPPVVDNYGFEFALSVVDYAGNDVSTQSDYQKIKSYSSYGRYNLYDENSPMTTGSLGTYMVPYAVPYVSKKFVDGKTNHDVYTTYAYKGISLTKTRSSANQVWQPETGDVTTRKLMTGFKVRYVSALNADGFVLYADNSELKKLIWQDYHVDLTVTTTNTAAKITAAKSASETAHKKHNFWVTYEDGGIVTLDSIAYTPRSIPGLTASTAAARMELPASATLAWMLNNNYLRITKASIDGDFLEVDAATGDNTGASAYVTGASKSVNFVSGSTVTSWTDTRAVNGIKLRRKYSTGGTTLTSDLRFKLTLTFEDVFGQESTKEIEVTMQHPKPL